jgi:hypothetical protein
LSDKIFGLSVQEVQEEIKKLQQPVKVNVHVANGKEIPIAWSTWSKKDLSSEQSSPLS